MAEVESIHKPRLTNGQHAAFMEAFQSRLEEFTFEEKKIQDLILSFKRIFAIEDKNFKQSQSNSLTPLINEAEKKRDKIYSCLKNIVNAWADNVFEEEKAAALAIKKYIDLYQIDIIGQRDNETGLMNNLLSDITTSEQKNNGKILGINKIVSGLREANEAYKQLLAQRDKDAYNKKIGALRNSRLETDSIYDEIIKILVAYSLISDNNEIYEDFINQWNGTVDRYNDMLNRKSTKNSPEEEELLEENTEEQLENMPENMQNNINGEETAIIN